MQYAQRIAADLNIKPQQVAATIQLLDGGNTIPFIARYRKEVTLNLDEFLIRQVEQAVQKWRTLDERRVTVLHAIAEQGKLTSALKAQIEAVESLTELEDIYLPYKPKRKTRASIARERGLEPLAQLILSQPNSGPSPQQAAQAHLNEQVASLDDALQGARDIVAEVISDSAAVRGPLREKAQAWAILSSKKIPNAVDEKQTFETYYAFSIKASLIRPHQTLALNRGEAKGVLKVSVEIAERDWRTCIESSFRPDRRSAWAEQLMLAIDDSAKRLLLPSIERDLRRHLTETAEAQSMTVFADNLRALLTQAPLTDCAILGIDPGFRTGCKVAVIDASSRLLETATIYPHEPQRQAAQALATLARLVERHQVRAIAIGNGTASRETEALVAQLTRQMPGVGYAIVSEAGASVYSASDLARQEMPDLDVSLRGAVSIARRLQDPLAELVKIDPKSIGVGQYQHDVDQKALGEALDGVVESVVNHVGVDANTASPALLRYVAGIGPKLAEAIVQHRDAGGPFKSRSDLKKVKGMGAKTYEQAAGFLRVRGGKHWLDASAIHPESYSVAQALIERCKIRPEESAEAREQKLAAYRQPAALSALAQEIGAGLHTLADIVEQLARPGRDPRQDVPPPVLRSDVLSLSDLREGMSLNGTVRNVVDFGAFVDIGVKQDGLLHVSKLPHGTRLTTGEVIRVIVLSVDKERGRISLGWPT